MTIAEHWVAHTRGGDRSLVEGVRARWLWARLRAAFPLVDAFVLMPDHLHLVLPPGLARRLERILRSFTAQFGPRFDVPEVGTAVNSPKILVRTLGYCFRNPVEDGLVADPWAWPWTTLRDLGGSIWDPWTPVRRVARRCKTSPAALVARVTANRGIACPLPGPVPREVAASLDACRAAVAATLRCDPAATRARGPARHLLIQLLQAVGPRSTVALAQTLDAHRRTVERALATPDPALPFALRSLADPRLRIVAAPTKTRVRHFATKTWDQAG